MQNPNPSFFKILIGDFASVLRLPPLFVKIFGEKLSPAPSLISVASGKSWAVKLNKNGKRYFFTDGWSVFVRENELKAGEFAVFWLENYSTFQVQLYDRTCCDKRLSSSAFFFPGFPGGGNSKNADPNVKVKIEIESEESKSEGEIIIVESETTSDSLVSKRSNLSPQKSPHTDTTSGSPSNDFTNPTFDTVLSESDHDNLIIPKGFVEESRIAEKRKIRVTDEQGRDWVMRIRNRGGEFVLCGGWAAFRKANRLFKGYVCSFKLLGSYGDQLQFKLERRPRGRPPGAKSFSSKGRK